MSLAEIIALVLIVALSVALAYALVVIRRPSRHAEKLEHEEVHENTLEVLKQRYGTDHGDSEVERERRREAV